MKSDLLMVGINNVIMIGLFIIDCCADKFVSSWNDRKIVLALYNLNLYSVVPAGTFWIMNIHHVRQMLYQVIGMHSHIKYELYFRM